MSFIENNPIRDGLGPDDLNRMNIGRRWWRCRMSQIPDGLSYKDVLEKYVAKIADHIRNGRGLLFHGEFSTGKTGAAVIVAKATVCHGGTAYFVPVTELSDAKFDKTKFDEEEGQTVWDRMQSVDLLILDDLGSEHDSNWGRSLVERVVRIRSNRTKSIICTTNRFKDLVSSYGDSTMAILKSITLPVLVTGKNWRDEEARDLSQDILGEA